MEGISEGEVETLSDWRSRAGPELMLSMIG